MKLITILFLCSRLLASLSQEFVTEEIDCDDEDVFKAVDAALKNYNNRIQSGNQFVLYRVTEVNKTVGSETFYSLKYQIKEGDCPVQSGKTWQDCDYKGVEEAATGECTATVGKRESTKFSVATQICQIIPAEGPVVTAQYTCRGCVYPISTESPDLEPILKHAIQHFNNNTKHSHLFALGEVKRAQRQVVAGWNYEITYSIVQTDCLKKDFLLLTPDCKSLSDGDVGECTDSAYVDPQLRIASFSQNCNIHSGKDLVKPHPKICPGCPFEIPLDSPELAEALTHSITKLNAENNETFYFKIDTVKRATAQVVAGKKFFIEFTARETTCSKEDNTELTESCETKNPGQSLSCNAEVYVIPWEQKVYPTINCQVLGMMTLMKRPPGFSPFRVVPGEKKEGGTIVSLPYTSMAPVQDEEQDPEKQEGPTRGHGSGSEKKIKPGLGHGHKQEHKQGHGHKRGHGVGHGPPKQNALGHGRQQQHGLDHGYQPKLDFDLEHGLDHGHQIGHDLAHGHKHKLKHGHGHEKHKNKDKNNGKLNDQRPEHLASFPEVSITSSTQTEEKMEGPTPIHSLTQPGVAVTSSDFQDSDLLEAVTPPMPPTPTENYDDLIPDIQIKPNSFLFELIPDFPETNSPKCPGRPWKPVNGNNPVMEMKEFHDFDLSDAL
ncbi:kininogen-1 isoform X1 [Marmota monax]|uniref:kininogen-1 isoform X1 n=1 Tax=Marmota monax TaxID=9995 RepID=UPI001EB063E5|nr:kininogen-1 isoform X1 [Marmota monax]KAI6051520.1 KNG1 [Marmota monax]KAI6062061.1 KNG1 [Marmota monax]